MNDLLQKLELIYQRWLQIGEDIAQPDAMNDMKKFIKMSKDYKDLQPVVDAYKQYKDVIGNIASAKEIVANEKDEEFRDMAKAELDNFVEERDRLEEDIRFLLLPKDPQDSKNAQMEIRAGTGGDEASIFAGDLFRMYQHYCDKKGWKIEILSMTEGTMGGYKEIDFYVTGDGVYGIMKYESGVHRVQRVPQTESQGRVHTSAASVVVLPEADEFDVELKQSDIKKETYHLLRRAPHPHPDGHRGFHPGRKIADQEPRKGHARAAQPPVRAGIQEISRRNRLQAQDDGLHRRPFSQDPDLQLPAEPRHRPPHQLHHVQPRQFHERRHRGGVECPAGGRERRAPERGGGINNRHLRTPPVETFHGTSPIIIAYHTKQP